MPHYLLHFYLCARSRWSLPVFGEQRFRIHLRPRRRHGRHSLLERPAVPGAGMHRQGCPHKVRVAARRVRCHLHRERGQLHQLRTV